MDRTTRRRRRRSAAGDRLSKLEDRVLSFLPAKEAARAALLSSRWRGVFAAVHTVSMDEPEPECADDNSGTTRGPSGRPSPAPSATPSSPATVAAGRTPMATKPPASTGSAQPWETAPYTVPASLFSCAELRSLSLSHCRLAPPAKVSLPSLETLLLSHVTDPGRRVEGIIAGCPSLVDLTLEACEEVVRLYVPRAARLRRLALQCCHQLRTVVVDDASELAAFEYRGPVPDTSSFLTMHGVGGGSKKVAYCMVDICGEEEASSEKLVSLRQLLRLFSNTSRLHLESARLGSGFDTDAFRSFTTMPRLRHLELRGCLPDDAAAVVDALGRILEHAPKLEVLTLVFHPEEHDFGAHPDRYNFKEEDLLDAHHLKYNPHSDTTVPSSTIRCLRKRVREINLVHYQGGRAQRMLAKFLLCNAPVMDNLCCVFAEGPLWTQTQLKREILGWVRNMSANMQFF